MDVVGAFDNGIWSSRDGKSLIGVYSRKDGRKQIQQM